MDQQKTYQLSCQNCNQLLLRRGQKVTLLSNPEINLFSSDLISSELVPDQETKKFEFCDCVIQDIKCRKCEKVVGYHVIKPCEPCSDGPNNGHYFMFRQVKGEPIENVFWGEIGAIQKLSGLPVVPECVLEDHQICAICLDMIEEACMIACGHTFCKVCITRQVDLKKECPLDKLTASPLDIIPNLYARNDLNMVLIRCQYGCELQGSQWSTIDSGCKQKVKLGERQNHEIQCPFKK